MLFDSREAESLLCEDHFSEDDRNIVGAACFIGKFDKPVLVTINKKLNTQRLGFITQEHVKNLRIQEGKIAAATNGTFSWEPKMSRSSSVTLAVW